MSLHDRVMEILQGRIAMGAGLKRKKRAGADLRLVMEDYLGSGDGGARGQPKRCPKGFTRTCVKDVAPPALRKACKVAKRKAPTKKRKAPAKKAPAKRKAPVRRGRKKCVAAGCCPMCMGSGVDGGDCPVGTYEKTTVNCIDNMSDMEEYETALFIYEEVGPNIKSWQKYVTAFRDNVEGPAGEVYDRNDAAMLAKPSWPIYRSLSKHGLAPALPPLPPYSGPPRKPLPMPPMKPLPPLPRYRGPPRKPLPMPPMETMRRATRRRRAPASGLRAIHTEFVKQAAADMGISYMQANSNPTVKQAWSMYKAEQGL